MFLFVCFISGIIWYMQHQVTTHAKKTYTWIVCWVNIVDISAKCTIQLLLHHHNHWVFTKSRETGMKSQPKQSSSCLPELSAFIIMQLWKSMATTPSFDLLHFSYTTELVSEDEYSNASQEIVEDFPTPRAIHSLIDLVLMCTFLLFGTIGNLLVIIVYLRNLRRTQSTANHFLCSLAVTDFTVCILVIPMHIAFEVTAMYRRITAAECKAIMVIWHQTLICSSWILVGISIDRFYSLCRPFDMQMHARRVRRIIVCIWLLSVLVAVPAVFYYGQPGCRYTAPVGSLKRIFLASVQAGITLILPLAIIGMNYLRIFLLLSKRKHRAHYQPGRGKLMSRTRYIVAKRLLLVIAVFVLCWSPRTVLEIYHSFVEEDLQTGKILTVYICRNILPYLNSVLNPLLYSMINPNFRHECWDILHCHCDNKSLRRANIGSFSRRSYRMPTNNGTWL